MAGRVTATVPGSVRAIDAPGIRGALRSYRRNAAVITLLGVVLVVGFVVLANRLETDSEQLERTGVRVPGRVVDVDPGFRNPGSIDVAFAVAGEQRAARIALDSSTHDYVVGQPVVVVIDREDPDHLSIVGESNDPPGVVLMMAMALVAGGFAVGIGATSLARVARQWRLLAAEPWRRVPARVRDVPVGRGAVRRVILIDEGRQLRIFTVAGTRRTRLARAGIQDRQDLELVGRLDGHIVVRAVRGVVVLSASRPRRAAARRRWLRRAFPDRRR